MALFAVTRYLGEDDDGESQKKKIEASTILQKLQADAKERRKSLCNKSPQQTGKNENKEREELIIVDNPESSEQVLSEKKRKGKADKVLEGKLIVTSKNKKHKQHHLDESVGNLNDSVASSELDNEDNVKAKSNKKKRKRSSLEGNSDTSFNTTGVETTVENERKKKRNSDKENIKSAESKEMIEADVIDSPSKQRKHKKNTTHTPDSSGKVKTGALVSLEQSLGDTDHVDTAADIGGDSMDSDDDEDKMQDEEEKENGDSDEDGDDMEVEKSEKKTIRKDGSDVIGGFTVIGNIKPLKVEKVKRVLPDWLSSPSVITADVRVNQLPVTEMPGLDEDLVHKLTENGIHHFFPVQMHVIPALLESSVTGFQTGRAGYRPGDICVSAPTGSGKTLAFVLPIVQALRSRVTCEVRALAVLPVRDLATQVYKVFQTYCKGTPLKVGLLIGQKTLLAEQHSLVRKRLRGHQSLFDIIVATPGRLVDHINKTDGFDLSHLRYLVIDEADRMMDEIKQDWLLQVEAAVYRSRPLPASLTAASCQKTQIPLQKLLYSATLSQNPEKLQQLNLFQPKLFTSVVKVTKNVKKLGQSEKKVGQSEKKVGQTEKVSDGVEQGELEDKELKKKEDKREGEVTSEGNEDKETETLVKSEEYVGKYSTPAGLSEYYIETTAGEKPLVILHLLQNLKYKNILCFTNSVEATHRLYLLIKLMGGVEVKEFSSGLHAAHRSAILQKFVAGKIDIIICSDAMARGMDISNVKYVISYDPPPYIQTYVHRIGRTARAGKDGVAITLLQKKEFFHFKKMVKEAGKKNIPAMSFHKREVKPLIPKFQETLKQLSDILEKEKQKTKPKISNKSEKKKKEIVKNNSK